MKNKLLSFLKIFLVPFIVALVCWGLFSLSYLLPSSVIINHMNNSIDNITDEEFSNYWLKNYAEAKNDDWSEETILSIVICPTKKSDFLISPLKLEGISVDGVDNPVENLRAFVSNPDVDYHLSSNNRYWNGFVMVLKLELMLFNLAEVKLFNMFVQLLLLASVIYLMAENKMKQEIIPFLLMIFIMNPATMFMSLKLLPEYIIMLASCIFVLTRKEEFFMSFEKAGIAFAAIGALTSFFNMLSFPLITLGIPLMFYMWKARRVYEVRISNIISAVFSWALGYGICWSCKWAASTLFTSENIILNAMERASHYHNEIDEDFVATVLRNLNVYNKFIYKFVFSMSIIWGILKIFKNKTFDFQNNIHELAGLCILIILPYVFFALAGPGYAYIHHFMAYRNLSFSFGAMVCIPLVLSSSPSSNFNYLLNS